VGFMVARVDKNKGCVDVLPLGGSDQSNNATSNKSIACFWGVYGLVPPHCGDGNNSSVMIMKIIAKESSTLAIYCARECM